MGVVTVLIPLPLEYNPDASGHRRAVEDEKFLQTAEEITLHFGEGGTLWRFPKGVAPRGFWWGRGVLDLDDLAVLEIDVPDMAESRDWLKRYACGRGSPRPIRAAGDLPEVLRLARHHPHGDRHRGGPAMKGERRHVDHSGRSSFNRTLIFQGCISLELRDDRDQVGSRG